MVRTTLLKNKDPLLILADLERLDQQEYNIHQPPTLAEKVLRDKRRKLTETWNRVISLYRKESSDRFLELKRLERDYEAKRDQMAKLYQAVKSAEEVVLDEIPLPIGADEESTATKEKSFANLEPGSFGKRLDKIERKPPGCPPGLPPKISDLEAELVGFIVEAAVNSEKKAVDEDLDQFLKEIEQVEQLEEKEEAKEVAPKYPVGPKATPPVLPMAASLPSLPLVNPTPCLSSIHAPVVPPLPYGSSITAPNRPPVFIPSMHTISSLPSIFAVPPPTTINRFPPTAYASPRLPGKTVRPEGSKPEIVGQATIEAKPQLRNLSADATRFLPVSLRVKRNETKPRPTTHKFEGIHI